MKLPKIINKKVSKKSTRLMDSTNGIAGTALTHCWHFSASFNKPGLSHNIVSVLRMDESARVRKK